MKWGDIIRSAPFIEWHTDGMGGTADTMWHCADDEDYIAELSVVDFTEIRSTYALNYPTGIGGDDDTIWGCGDLTGWDVYELSTVDLSVDRTVGATGFANGIGGDASVIWYVENDDDKVYELSTVDLSVVRSANAPGEPYGVGGKPDVIWGCKGGVGLYELYVGGDTLALAFGANF